MPDIKTRDVVSGTIKAVDRSTLAGQRMKNAYVQAKDKAEHSVYSSEGSGEEYASDRLEESAETIAREVAHQMDMVGHKVLHHKKQSRQSAAQSTAGSLQVSPDNGNPTNAQQPHQVSSDGAVFSGSGGHSRVGSDATVPKQETIRNKQVASAKADLKAKRDSPWTASSAPQVFNEDKIPHGFRSTVEKNTANQTVKSTKRITIKASQALSKQQTPR